MLEEINKSLIYHGVKFGLREEYAIEYLEDILSKYAKLCNINPDEIVISFQQINNIKNHPRLTIS